MSERAGSIPPNSSTHDIDVGARDQRGGIARDEFCGQPERGIGFEAAVGDAGQFKRGAELALVQRGIAPHQLDHALADRAASEQGYPYRFQRCTESPPNRRYALGARGRDARTHPGRRHAQAHDGFRESPGGCDARSR